MNTLFLTAEEQKVFEALPAKLREGWKVEGVALVSERPEELTVRQGMASERGAMWLTRFCRPRRA